MLAVPTVYSQKAAVPKLSFEALQKNGPENTIFQIEGYIYDIYTCTPKPCRAENIMLVNSADFDDPKLLKLRIYTNKTDKFELERKYLLTVGVGRILPAGGPVISGDLIKIDKIGPAVVPKTAVPPDNR